MELNTSSVIVTRVAGRIGTATARRLPDAVFARVARWLNVHTSMHGWTGRRQDLR